MAISKERALSLTVVVVHYKSLALTKRCLHHIFSKSLLQSQIEVIVVDNNSCDNAKEEIVLTYPNIVWVTNLSNEGFGRANNRAFKIAQGEYVLCLNSDVFVNPETLQNALATIKENHQIGVLGCKLINPNGQTQKSVWYHLADFGEVWKENLVLDKYFPLKKKDLKAVSGAFMLMRKSLIDQVGGFDPDFFLYSEELDLCLRIRSEGYDILFSDQISADHLHGAGTENKIWSYKQKHLSHALLYQKHKGPIGLYFYLSFKVVNTITNFFAMWALNKQYRKDFFRSEKQFYSQFARYLAIPFHYSNIKPEKDRSMLIAKA